MGKFFFTLNQKGDIPALAKPKIDPTTLGKAAAAAGPKKEEKPAEDPIDKSLALRIKDGNLQNTIKPKAGAKDEEVVWKLKLSGAGPDLELAKENKNAAPEKNHPAAQAARKSVVSDMKGLGCEIESSLTARKKEGAINSVIRDANKDDSDVFTLKQTGTILKPQKN